MDVATSAPVSGSTIEQAATRQGRILVVEDDPHTAEEIVACLRAGGFDTEHSDDGVEALARALTGEFDGITLDRMLPRLDGLELLRSLRRSGCEAPVLMVSALSDVDDRVMGLRAGGDDYLIKPFAPNELLARLEVLLRRQRRSEGATTLVVGDLELDLVRRHARRGARVIELLPMEFKLLEFMMRNAGQLLTRRMIFEAVWGYYFDPGTNLIDVHVGKLRRKIDEPDRPPMFTTERGVGYLLHAR